MTRKCARCGRENPEDAGFCMVCGRKLVPDAPPEPPGTSSCPNCGQSNPAHSVYCGKCGGELPKIVPQVSEWPGSYGQPSEQSYYDDDKYSGSPARSSVLTVGAILTIVCGLLALGGGILIALMGNDLKTFDSGIGGSIVLCGVVTFVLGAIGIVGGNFALKQENNVASIVCSVLGMLGGFVAFGIIGLLLGIVGVVLIAVARDDFVS